MRRRIRRTADVLLRRVGSVGAVAVSGRQVVLTFDDGPHPTRTPDLLDLLGSRSVTVTFFVLVSEARRHPDLVRRMVAEGHDVGLHGEDHSRLTTLSRREVRRRTRTARDDLERIAGVPVTVFRPPYGAQSLSSYLTVRTLGLDVVVWGPYAAEWEGGTPSQVAARAMRGMAPGAIVLLHDGLYLPDGQPDPDFDRTKAFSLLLDALTVNELMPTSLSGALRTGRVRRTAWFRP